MRVREYLEQREAHQADLQAPESQKLMFPAQRQASEKVAVIRHAGALWETRQTNERESRNRNLSRLIDERIPKELNDNVFQLMSQLSQAQGDVQTAKSAIERHKANVPDRTQVSDYAKLLTILQNELNAYELILSQTETELSEAQRALEQARKDVHQGLIADASNRYRQILKDSATEISAMFDAIQAKRQEWGEKLNLASDELSNLGGVLPSVDVDPNLPNTKMVELMERSEKQIQAINDLHAHKTEAYAQW
jgi:hypothetical protein